MVRNDLVSYIYQYYTKGYPLPQIRGYLLGLGYVQSEVDEAVNYVAYYYAQPGNIISTPQVSHTHSLSLKTSILVVVLVFFVCSFLIGGYMLINTRERTENKLLDVNTEIINKELLPGEKLNYKIALSNFGSEGRFDIMMTSEVYDQTKTLVSEKHETFALETSSQYVRSVEIPADSSPGRYEVRVRVDYAGQKATSSSFFSVITRAKNTTIEKIERLNQTVQRNQTNHTAIGIPGIKEHEAKQQSIGEILTSVAQLEPAEAIGYCNAINDELYRDTCFSELSKKAKDPELCNKIISTTKKDACLILFALNEKNFEVCESITDKKLSISCLQLQKKHDNNASILSLGW